MRICGLLFCMMLLTSCRDVEKESKIADVESWIGKEIQFPTDGIFTRMGRDTVFCFPKLPYTIVNYIDSAGCVECRLRALEWKDFMNRLEMKYPGMVSQLFYIQPKNMKELIWILRGDDFSYPVCIDKNGDFNKMNQLPSDEAFGTFLLNANKEVLLVGSPVGNKSLERLYMDEFEHYKKF